MSLRIIIMLLILLMPGYIFAADTETRKETIFTGNKFCPVSGEKIDETSQVKYEYKGKVYRFCCPVCIEEFKKDPERYIEKMEKQEEKGSDEIKPHHYHEHHHN
ncbi:MAG: YHS domain-containing protein [Thermodesulfovibrionales bacterium]